MKQSDGHWRSLVKKNSVSAKKHEGKEKNEGPLRTLWSLFVSFFKIGLFTIGGGMAMIPLIQKTVVEDKKWMDEEEMLDCIAVSQALPGVIAVNSATYIGNRRCGWKGSIAATLGVILPSFIIIILIVVALGFIEDNKYVIGAFTGIKAAVTGLIAVAVFRLGKQVLHNIFQWTIAAVSFILIAVLGITAIWAVIIGAVAGIIAVSLKNRRKLQ